MDSLIAKVYSEPPTIETLSLRLNPEASPAPLQPMTETKIILRKSSKDFLSVAEKSSGQQILTTSELSERQNAWRLLEYKKMAPEKAVGKRDCEKGYDKIWRHKSTFDGARNEKLQSQTAALPLGGIGLQDLGIDDGEGNIEMEKATSRLRRQFVIYLLLLGKDSRR